MSEIQLSQSSVKNERDPALDILENSLEYLEKYGWVQDVGMTVNGAVCLSSALHRGYNITVKDQEESLRPAAKMARGSGIANRLVKEQISKCSKRWWRFKDRRFSDPTGFTIVAWNDTKGRRKSEVVNLLRACIKTRRATLESIEN